MPPVWLHISDFHFKNRDRYDRDVILGALVKSVRRLREKEGRRPDLIFATGDVAFSGKAAEYEHATKFFDDLCAAAGVEKRNLFVVPGNHDVDRDAGDGLKDTLSSREEADRYFDPSKPKLHIAQRQRAFIDWHNRYFDDIRAFPENSTCAPYEIVDVRGCKMGVLRINSAVFCHGDHDNEKLWLGRRCLDTAVAEMQGREADLNVALMHHPLDWLHQAERANVTSSLRDNVDVILRGHLHESGIELSFGTTGEALHIAAGAAYQTEDYPNRALYCTFQAKQIEVYPIGYAPIPRPVWTLDTSLFPETPHTGNFDVPRLTKKSAPSTSSPLPVAPVSEVRSDISRIIRYAPEKLIGREAETKILAEAWAKARNDEQERPRVLTFVALGGEGKTSLVAKWAAELAYKGWPGCEAAFAWSFYSQGTREQMAASSDLFLKAALVFFGDAATAESAQSAFDKGKRLAQLVAEKRALLILDGLEPLQYAPASPMSGDLKDEGLKALLKGLAQKSRGLCIVTTRYSIPDLRAFRQGAAPEVALKRLSKEAGVALLRALGVKGTQAEYEKLVEDVKGHALTLNLLGSFLRDAHGGDIRKRDLVKLEEADAEEQNGHAFRAMDAYAQWFESEGEKGSRALALLRLLGLFDRPADAGCLGALWKAPAIEGLTEPLIAMSEAQRNIVLKRLEDAGLLTVNRDKSGALVSLDAHPLLREYFAGELRTNQAAWQAAHKRLYEHLCATTKEGNRPTLDDLQPLYHAVAHGCQAGLQKEACQKVYRDRILRGTGSDGFYSVKKLGAFGSDLGAVACFFDPPWSRVSDRLAPADQAWLLNSAAFNQRSLGRLTEALEPMRSALDKAVEQENWKSAAARAGNLSELELTLGDVAGALKDAETSMTHADRSGEATERIISRTTHADALQQAGRQDAAAARFAEAEAIQAEWQRDYPLLYSLRGFQHSDLLLNPTERAAWRRMLSPSLPTASLRAAGEAIQESRAAPGWLRSARSDGPESPEALLDSCRAVSQRVAQTLQWAEENNAPLLDFALNYLTLGRAALYAAVLAGAPPDDHSRRSLRDAVDGLRRAGHQDHLPRGLLSRAWLRRIDGDFKGAREDLDEAFEIAERGPMPLFLAEIHLQRARLFGAGADGPAAYPWESPQADLAETRRLIFEHGYLRRKEDLEDAETAIFGTPAA